MEGSQNPQAVSHFRPAVFLDRDGTLNEEKNYVSRYEDWEWIPGAKTAMKELRKSGFELVVVSNQSGIARGFFKTEDVLRLHERVSMELQDEDIGLAGFYFCPHGPGDGCECRKPRPGLILQAIKELGLDGKRSYMVGDKHIDVLAGQAAGVTSVLVGTGYGKEERRLVSPEVRCFGSLLDAARWVVQDFKKGE